MNGYICTKNINLGGTAYQKGETIPGEAVLPNRVRALTREGYIAAQNDAAAVPPETPQNEPIAPAPIVLPITKNGGVMELVAAPGDIIQAVSILQLNAEEAAKAVAEVESEEALILIDALDTRKTVRTATAARAEELNKSDENGQDDGQEGQKTGDA